MRETMDTMVAGMVAEIVTMNGGEVVYNLPNCKKLTIKIEDREPTLEEQEEQIAKFLTNMGLEQTEPSYDEPVVCLTYDEMGKLMRKVAELM
jgi:hypothetical protein